MSDQESWIIVPSIAALSESLINLCLQLSLSVCLAVGNISKYTISNSKSRRVWRRKVEMLKLFSSVFLFQDLSQLERENVPDIRFCRRNPAFWRSHSDTRWRNCAVCLPTSVFIPLVAREYIGDNRILDLQYVYVYVYLIYLYTNLNLWEYLFVCRCSLLFCRSIYTFCVWRMTCDVWRGFVWLTYESVRWVRWVVGSVGGWEWVVRGGDIMGPLVQEHEMCSKCCTILG